MGIEANYRSSILKREITEALNEILKESSPVIVWQNDNGLRNIVKTRIKFIDFATNSIVMAPYSKEDELNFIKLNINLTFYIRGNVKSIVFKQEKPAKKIANGFLQIFIPNEAKMFEKRSEKRITPIEKYLPIHAHICPSGRTNVVEKYIAVELYDLSTAGIGLRLNKRYSRLFFEKDKIKIEKIGDYNFLRPIHGKIIYCRPDNKNKIYIRIGIQFNTELTIDILKKILIP